MGNTVSCRVAAAGLLLATPVATWWLVGDLSATVPPGTSLDYTIRPPAIAPWAERVAGIGALLVTGAALAVLVRGARRRRFDRRWWAALLPAVAAGGLAGLGWRVMTAGTIGANVGAGLTILVGGPVVALLLLWAIGWSAHLLRSARP